MNSLEKRINDNLEYLVEGTTTDIVREITVRNDIEIITWYIDIYDRGRYIEGINIHKTYRITDERVICELRKEVKRVNNMILDRRI